MKPIGTFVVTPTIPDNLLRLKELAYNLRWSWDHATIELFRRLDSDLWESSGNNPVKMLGTIEQRVLESAARNKGFLADYHYVLDHYDKYMKEESTWFSKSNEGNAKTLVAYFCAEFGIVQCLSIFAGGLGVLAGDYLKSASDLGLPLVGVGLLYQQGYFRQVLNESGMQIEVYEDNDFYNLPIFEEADAQGQPLKIEVEYPDHPVKARIWRAQVGRVPLYLLDTNVAENSPDDQKITYQLYGGDSEMRIKQEIMLGIGGYKALGALGLDAVLYHMNEGHSAFLALERIHQLSKKYSVSFMEAKEAASAGLVFTTHTPVPAGHDYFPPEMMHRYFDKYIKKAGISFHDFMALGRQNPKDEKETFCMTILALRLAAHSNGVSRLHGQVSRKMWQNLYPDVPLNEIPIDACTNGVHFESWISREMKELYDRYLGLRWREEPADRNVWKQAENIATEELWRTHVRRRERLVVYARESLRRQLQSRRASVSEIDAVDSILDTKVFTIGFARRFATYKRATLLWHDQDRLVKMLNNPERPVQIIIAGKAHPKDEPGQELIQKIVKFASQEPFRRRVVFIENYDIRVARYLVQGCDVWLNTPSRPREASGTSGMKAAANGLLNISILDGWWDEMYQPSAGWAIGSREEFSDPHVQDHMDAESLYNLLENEVLPLFYYVDEDGLPQRWIAKMKASIEKICFFVNTHRMVNDYTERYYVPAFKRYKRLMTAEMKKAKELAAWRDRIHQHWSHIRIEEVTPRTLTGMKVGDSFAISAKIRLGSLEPQDVGVELYLGNLDANNEIQEAEIIPMQSGEKDSNGTIQYQSKHITCRSSGLQGFTIRVVPNHADLVTPFIPGHIVWAS